MESLEFPLATFRVCGSRTCPWRAAVICAFSLLVYPSGLRRAWRESLPVVAYIHPWELDPSSRASEAPFRSRFRHYTNLAKTESRLRRLLARARFTSFRNSGLLEML